MQKMARYQLCICLAVVTHSVVDRVDHNNS